MTTAENYIQKVLEVMPPKMPLRPQIAEELSLHIQERVAHGHQLDEVLRQLGDPIKLAESYLSAEPLVSAPLGRRLLAKIIDVLIVLITVVPVAIGISLYSSNEMVAAFAIIGAIAGGSVFFGLYSGIAEWRWTQTLGKRLFGIRVVRESGARIGFGQAMVRQLPLFLQVFLIDALFIPFTEHKQRAFEMLSKTRVVRAGS